MTYPQRVAAILGESILSTVLMAMIVPEPEDRRRSGYHPRARAILAHMKRNANLLARTLAHMHDKRLTRKTCIRSVGADDMSCKRTPA